MWQDRAVQCLKNVVGEIGGTVTLDVIKRMGEGFQPADSLSYSLYFFLLVVLHVRAFSCTVTSCVAPFSWAALHDRT